jgi:AraC-like DNA-binding protein
MDDVLLQLHGAAPHETAASADYHWVNRTRRGRGLILQYTFLGEGRLRRGRRVVPCRPGQALIMREGDRTEYFFPPAASVPWTFCWINFSGAEPLWKHWITHQGDVLPLDPDGESVGVLRQITRLYRDKAFLDRYHASDLLGRLLASLGRAFSGTGSPHTPPARRALDILRDHHRRPLNIKELAGSLGLSREHLTRLFVQEHGRPPAAVLRDLRLATARRLLRQTVQPVHAVAEASGFGSTVHFCRAFKAAHGQTPETYRASRSEKSPPRTAKLLLP